MSVALGNYKPAVTVGSSREGAKRSNKFLASLVGPVECIKLSVGCKVPNRSMNSSAQHPVVAVNSSGTRDTIAINSPSSAPRREQKRDATSGTAGPVDSGSKRRSVQKSTAVTSGGHVDNNERKNRGSARRCPETNVFVSLFFITENSYSRQDQWSHRLRFDY